MSRHEVFSFMNKFLYPVYVVTLVFLLSPNAAIVEAQENVVDPKESSSVNRICEISTNECYKASEIHVNGELEKTELNAAVSSHANSKHAGGSTYHFWNKGDSGRNFEEHSSQAAEKIWIPHVLPAKLANFRPKSRSNELCNLQSDLFERSLRNLTLWALQMREATASTTAGMLLGEHYNFGHYDECIGVHNPSISGRYCLAQIKFSVTRNAYPVSYAKEKETASPYSSVLDVFAPPRNTFTGLESDTFNWGICVPAACSHQDVEESLIETLSDVTQEHGITLTIHLSDTSCSSAIDEQSLPLSSKAVLYVLASLSALSIVATLYHLLSDNETLESKGSLTREILMSFSMVNNLRSLTRLSGKENLNLLDALKFYFTVFILMFHRTWYLTRFSLLNLANYQMDISSNPGMDSIVDIFFTISGFLLFWNCYTPLKKSGSKIIPSIIFNRWFRLMPAYLTIIIFTMTLLPYTSSGPLWKHFIPVEASRCRRHWWKNILGINNIAMDGGKDAPYCVPTGWYLGNELQLLLVGVLVVYALSKSHKTGLIVYFVTLAASIIIPFSIVYINNYDGAVRFKKDHRSLLDVFKSKTMMHIYLPGWCRAGPYLIGIIAGFSLLKIKTGEWDLSVSARRPILLVASILSVGVSYCTLQMSSPDHEHTSLTNASFPAFQRHIHGVIVAAFIVVQLAWGFGKHIDQFLTHNIYVPLGRLSYPVYLVHASWQMISTASSRSSLNMSVWNIVGLYASDVLISFLAALWLHFIIEAPFNKIRTALMRRRSGEKQHKTESKQKQHDLNAKNM